MSSSSPAFVFYDRAGTATCVESSVDMSGKVPPETTAGFVLAIRQIRLTMWPNGFAMRLPDRCLCSSHTPLVRLQTPCFSVFGAAGVIHVSICVVKLVSAWTLAPYRGPAEGQEREADWETVTEVT